MTDEARFQAAYKFAAEKHEGQRRIGGEAYITHPVKVAEYMREAGYGVDGQIAALFHDLLEDTDATEAEIIAYGSPEILDIVKRVSKEKGYRMAEYVARIREHPTAFALKGFDRLHNLKSLVTAEPAFIRRYLKETKVWFMEFHPEIPGEVFELEKRLDKQTKIVTAGHICLDLSPRFPADSKPLSEIFAPTRLTQVDGIVIATGGACPNVGLSVHALGGNVTLMSKVGNDAFGKIILDYIEAQGEGLARKVRAADDGETSFSMVFAVPGNDRFFITNEGTNADFGLKDLDLDEIRGAAHFHFGYPTVMRSMFENDGEAMAEMFKTVRATGVRTSLDTTSLDETSEAAKADWRRIFENVAPYVDYFVPSIEELCFMIDRERFDSWKVRAGGKDMPSVLDIDRDIVPVLAEFEALGARKMMVKCGSLGICYKDENGGFFVPSFVPEKIVSGVGCGDAAIAAFFTALYDGESTERAVTFAAAAGALCLGTYDTTSGLKPLKEISRMIEEGWARNGEFRRL